MNWDTTENLYIEGDNLDVLKLLQESYLGAVKMIYIDPPYNTGSDSFVYPDSYVMEKDEYEDELGIWNEDGDRLYRENNITNPRFHSVWCSMMYSRLTLARNLLTDDGVIFISIGQAEVQNLAAICNEVFGSANSCGIISRVMKSGGAKGRFFSPNMEYILVYGKDLTKTGCFREPISEEIISKLYTSIETEGERKGEKYRPFGLYQSSLDARPNYSFNNSLLIWAQRPDASAVCGFRGWQTKFGRTVNPGAKGIMIYEPSNFKRTLREVVTDEDGNPILDKDGNKITRAVERTFPTFKVGYVFALEDTSGKPLPSIVSIIDKDVSNYNSVMDALRKVSPAPIRFDAVNSGANGYYDLLKREIVVKDTLPQLEKQTQQIRNHRQHR